MFRREIVSILLILITGTLAFSQNEESVLEFPLIPPTVEQIEVAKACNLADDNIQVNEPATACEWIIKALKDINTLQNSDDLTEYASFAYQQAILENPAIALVQPVYETFSSRLEAIISPPLLSDDELSAIHLYYNYSGEGDLATYNIVIEKRDNTFLANGGSTVISTTHEEGEPTEVQEILEDFPVSNELVFSIDDSLQNLIPINTPVEARICENFTVEWEMTLVYGKTELLLSTYGSQISPAGGPWQVLVDEQVYLQVDFSLFWKVRELTYTLQLPEGFPMFMQCNRDYGLFSLAYPDLETNSED